jgi:eukaryotic-like serine/threonine-protein kinase
MGDSDPLSIDPLLGKVLGRYLLVRLLGEGGMGAVYEATHQELGRRAAIKVLHERYTRSADVRQRFVREGQSASRVRHPNVVDVYDVGIGGNHPYLVMEFLEGETLGQFLDREGLLSPERTADLLLPVLAAVAAAHDVGVVHRDLKPENILLSAERNSIKPKVLDFGISKVVDRDVSEQLTGTGAFLGTPQYMSPEQAQGAKHIEHRSDQYSLGVMLYLCATGRRPVEESSLYALIQRIVNGEFPPPSQINPSLPSAFEAMILRAMARNPEGRFPTTRALGRALLEFASARARSQYADEFEVDPLSSTAVDRDRVTPSVEPQPPNAPTRHGTTLGDSVTQRDAEVSPGSPRRWLVVGGLAAGVVAFFGLRSLRSVPSVMAPPLPAAAALAPHPSAVVAEPPPAAPAPAPVATKDQSSPPASASASAGAMAASRAPQRNPATPAKPAIKRVPTLDDRPGLAPR